MRRNVSFNLEPEVNFYKKRSAHVDPDVEPAKPFVLGPVPAAFIHAPDPLANLFPQLLISEIELQQQPPQSQPESPQPPPPPQEQPESPPPPPPPTQEQPESPQPPPPLTLRVPAQKRLLYEDHEMSPTAQDEIIRARAHEAAVRAGAIAIAYSEFTAKDTPEQHATPAPTASEQQPLSPFVLPPAASPLGRCEAKTPRI